MFIIPCKYVEGCLILESVSAIRKYHPNVRIVVIDSDSSDKSYFSELKKIDNVDVLDIANKHYESGAFWCVARHTNAPFYVVMQDSIILKQSLDKYLLDDEQFYAFINFNEDTLYNHMMNQDGMTSNKYLTRLNEMLGGFGNLPMDLNINFTGVFGPSFIVKKNMVDKMLENGLDKTMLPVVKFDHEITERAYGIIAQQCGVDVSKNTILGNLHDLKSKYMNGNVLVTNILDKHWFANKRQ